MTLPVGAAQAAARVDDRRLLRVLDVINLPASATEPASVAVVSEWATGRNLERTMRERGEHPFEAAAGRPGTVAQITRG